MLSLRIEGVRAVEESENGLVSICRSHGRTASEGAEQTWMMMMTMTLAGRHSLGELGNVMARERASRPT